MNNHNDPSLSKSFQSELENIAGDTILAPAYRKRKLILWAIRAIISAALYVIFWKHEWVRWTLVLTAPISLLSLSMIIIGPYLLKRKIAKTRHKIEAVEKRLQETEDARTDN